MDDLSASARVQSPSDQCGERLCVESASWALARQSPRASAAFNLLPPLRLWLPLAVFIAGLSLAAPVFMAHVALSSLYGFFAVLSLTRLVALTSKPVYCAQATLPRNALPLITVMVALHNEAEVCGDLVKALKRLDYPRERLEFILLLENHDRVTIAAAEHAAPQISARVLVLPAGTGPMTKPRALNYGLQLAKGELVAIYDAEDAPHPGQLIAAAEAFAANAKVGVVQAPLGWYNRASTWLTRQFGIEYAVQFSVLLPLYARLSFPLPLGGTSNVFRRRALDDVCGWDAFNVTEDADLGFRLARFGWKAGMVAPGTLEEAPETLGAWTAQRSRWLKGHLVTWLVHMRDIRTLAEQAGGRAVLGLQLTLLANVFGAASFAPGLILIGLAGVAIWTDQAGIIVWTGLAIAALSLVTTLALILLAAKRTDIPLSLIDILRLPAYWLAQTPALVRALRELVQAPYMWAKTEHGLSEAQRVAPDGFDTHAFVDGHQRSNLRVFGMANKPAE